MTDTDWPMKDAALEAARRLAGDDQPMPAEVLRIDQDITAIVVVIDGADYILTMRRIAHQRPRPH